MSLAEIKQSATRLEEREKGDLAAWLLDSLPPHSDDDAAADSLHEATRRREELDSGSAQAMSADEFWATIERERRSWK